LSAYSRENSIGRDATNDFLNEAIGEQRLPVKAHFNVMIWTENKSDLKDLKNLVSSGLAQMDAVAKIETAGAPQIYWAGIPGNESDFPMNDSFDTFAEQACCFSILKLIIAHLSHQRNPAWGSFNGNQFMLIYQMNQCKEVSAQTATNLFSVLLEAENPFSPITWFDHIMNKVLMSFSWM
jgi:hypothetical protein